MTNWFITGVSRGLGRALAVKALERGDTVVGTVRSPAFELPHKRGRLHILTADLRSTIETDNAVTEAFRLARHVDVIVNNAGYGLLGAVETATKEDVQTLFDVDFFAPLRIIQRALPFLREQGRGHIINVTSIAGRAPTTGAAIYSAAKAALEGLSIGLAKEVGPLGIKVTAIAPGAFRTDFLTSKSAQRSAPADDEYSETIGRSDAAFNAADGKQLGDPDRAAQAILYVVDAKDPPMHLLLGSDALARAREKLAAVSEEMSNWEAATRSTDYGLS